MADSIKFLRMNDLQEKVGLSRSQIYKLIAEGDFPKQDKVGERISVWQESKVEKWMFSKIEPEKKQEEVIPEVVLESEEDVANRVLNRHQGGDLCH